MLVFSSISIVYADMIPLGYEFHMYDSPIEKVDSLPMISTGITGLLIIMFFVIGLVLLTLAVINKLDVNNEDNNSTIVLKKIFFVINIVLTLFLIYMTKVIDERGYIGPTLDKAMYVFYAIMMLIFGMISKKKKNKKIIYIAAVCFTILFMFIGYMTLDAAIIGYYTYDPSIVERYEQVLKEL